jgi:hypothetical protein
MDLALIQKRQNMRDALTKLEALPARLLKLIGRLWCGALLLGIASNACAELEFAGHRISALQVNMQDRSTVELPQSKSLITKSVSLESGTTATQLLLSNGIAPDVGAYSLLYSLNPDMHSEADLQRANMLTLPIYGDFTVPSGHLISFFLDRDLVDELGSVTKDLSSALGRLSRLDNTKVSVRKLRDCEHWLQTMVKTFQQRRGPVTSRETLDLLVKEATMLSQLAKITPEALTKLQLSRLDALHADIRREIVRFDDIMAGAPPGPEPRYPVIVDILGQDKSDSPLRIYYTLNGLFQDPPTDPPVRSVPFPTIGSSSKNFMPAKNYRIWAAPDGQPGKPATPRILVELRAPGSEGVLRVSLSVAK